MECSVGGVPAGSSGVEKTASGEGIYIHAYNQFIEWGLLYKSQLAALAVGE